MSSTAFFRLSQTSFHEASDFTPIQAQVDGIVTHALMEAGNTSSFTPILTGNVASRLARTGILALGSNATGWVARAVQAAGAVGSVGAEVTAFEGMSRLIQTFPLTRPAGTLSLEGEGNKEGRLSQLWRWGGEGGWRQGLFTSGISFTALRGAGRAAQGQNIVFQHAAQSTAMVAGHNIAGALRIIPLPEGALPQQFFDAEIMNIQLAASMGAFHTVAPGVHALERNLEMNLRVGAKHFPDGHRENALPLRDEWNPFSLQTAVAEPHSSSPRENRIFPHVLLSENMQKAGGGGGAHETPRKEHWYPFRLTRRSPMRVEYSGEAERQMEALEVQIRKASEGLENVHSLEELRVRRPDENLANSVWFHQLRHFARTLGVEPKEFMDPEQLLVPLKPRLTVENPEVLREAVRRMRREGLGEDAFRVIELEIPYEEVLFGRPENKERATGLRYIQETIEGELANTVRLAEAYKGRGFMRVRFMSLSLNERLLQVVHGPDAPLPFYVEGSISRDLSIHLKALGASAVGINRGPLRLGDLQVTVHPFIFALHDLFHTACLAEFTGSFRRYAGWVYDLFRRNRGILRSPFYAEMMDRLADLNPPTVEGERGPSFFLGHTIVHLAKQFQVDSQSDQFTVSRLMKYQFFFHDLHTILTQNPPENPQWRDWHDIYRNEIKGPLDYFSKMVAKLADTYFRMPKEK